MLFLGLFKKKVYIYPYLKLGGSLSQLLKPEEYYKLYEDPTQREEYRKLLKVLSNKTTSRAYFEESPGKIYKKRTELHENILKSILNEYESSNNPSIHFFLGSIGSGKTSAKDQILEDKQKKTDFVFINFDDLKKKLPEYKLLKELNPKKAAQFVQSESARLAGKLFKKAVQKKCNIIFEKNIRKDKKGKIQLKEEIMKVVNKGYSISIHIVFLDSYEEAWRRVQKRAEEIKRYVPKQEVKETFNSLFPNFNTLYQSLLKEFFSIYLWYNGHNEKKAVFISFILTRNFSEERVKHIKQIKYFQKKGFYSGWIKEVRFNSLPKKVMENLKKLDFFKNLP